MEKSEAEEAMGALFDDVLGIVDLVEERLLKGEGKIPDGIMEDLEKVWEDICELRRRDYSIRKSLGINEDSFQAALKTQAGINPYRKRLIQRVEQLNRDIRQKMTETEMNLRAIGGGQLDSEKEEERQATLKRLELIRRIEKRKDWKNV